MQIAVSDNSTVSSIVCEASVINVTIQVVQDLAPVFTQDSYNGTIDERAPEGTYITMVMYHVLFSRKLSEIVLFFICFKPKCGMICWWFKC